MGIVDYVNKQRIERSIVLLTTTTMNITEISEVVGFSSLRYFSKVFKSIKGRFLLLTGNRIKWEATPVCD